MGFPVLNVCSFEQKVQINHKKYRNPFAILLFVNANSDSKVKDCILNNFSLMNILSKEINFYLPGYYTAQNESDAKDLASTFTQLVDDDYHDPYPVKIFKTYSNVLVFSDSDLAEFVMTIAQRTDYIWLGGNDIILLPIDEKGNVIYNVKRCFNLDKISVVDSTVSIDQFILQMFNVLRNSIIEEDLLAKLDGLYKEAATRVKYDYSTDYNLLASNIKNVYGDDFFFISYSSKDIKEARRAKEMLESRGFKVWMAPDGIPSGHNYSEVIPSALNMNKYFILLLSDFSAYSPWVTRELNWAISQTGRTKIGVLLLNGFDQEDIQNNLKLKFQLECVQVRYDIGEVLNNESLQKTFIQCLLQNN